MRQRLTYMRLLLAVGVLMALAACASMGRPQGGPRDVDPPVFVKSTPSPGQLEVDRRRISIEFDENVQIKDVMSKVVISPAQQTMPLISALGRRVVVDTATLFCPTPPILSTSPMPSPISTKATRLTVSPSPSQPAQR